jgi:hypothetical protein
MGVFAVFLVLLNSPFDVWEKLEHSKADYGVDYGIHSDCLNNLRCLYLTHVGRRSSLQEVSHSPPVRHLPYAHTLSHWMRKGRGDHSGEFLED